MERLLSIDPAKRCGWAFTDGRHLQSGVWLLGNNPLAVLADLLRTAARKLKPEAIAYESATFGSHHLHVMRKHNELAGVIQLIAGELCIPAWCYNPGQWKAAALGKGNLDKQGVMRMLRIFHGIEVSDADQADAIGVLLAAQKIGPPPEPVKKARRRAEKALLKRQGKLFRI